MKPKAFICEHFFNTGNINQIQEKIIFEYAEWY